METNVIYQGECSNVMQENIPDNSIDLTVTSPPYDDLREYEGYEFNYKPIAEQLYRVTKEGGVVVWVVGDQTIDGSETGNSFRQALYFKEIGFNLHDTMIYAKQNPIPLTHNRYEQQFEYMFVFSKGKPKTFNPIKIETKNQGTKRNVNYEVGATNEKNSAIRSGMERIWTVKNERIKYNIWICKIGANQTTNDKKAFNHPAIFPEKLAKDHIKSWSNEGDVILDPMCGSGTVLKQAEILKRKWIGIDIAEKYVNLSYKRVGKVNRSYYKELPKSERPAQKQLF